MRKYILIRTHNYLLYWVYWMLVTLTNGKGQENVELLHYAENYQLKLRIKFILSFNW